MCFCSFWFFQIFFCKVQGVGTKQTLQKKIRVFCPPVSIMVAPCISQLSLYGCQCANMILDGFFFEQRHGRDNLVQPLPDGTSNTPEIYIVEIPLDCTTADTFRNDQSRWDGLT